MPTESQATAATVRDYQSLDELMRHEERHRDWDLSFVERGTWLVVVAPHAKTIEPFTELIAAKVARDDYSLFVFEGLRRNTETKNWLHVSSESFVHPDLERLQANSGVTLSVHGAANNNDFPERVTHIGGKNDILRDLIWDSLSAHGFSVRLGSGRLAGMSDKNFVNKTANKGVQLEVSRGERESLADNPVRLHRYVDGVRWAINRYNLSLYRGAEA
ncbi:poly-gamma-glutamate hydrolase family protein [Candidatus Obscuribacterales bacterium]|nr:poly-gamma-glutamate hydrolase family protein [Candidatus Obscuribacterales bacterium]